MSPEFWLKIEALFQEAVELPPHERASFLDQKCASDEKLRLEVEKLLANDDSAGDFIESPVWSESAVFNTSAKKNLSESFDEEVNGNNRDDLIGKKIGVYRLTRELGRGGMGAVYLAERSDGEFQQRAAIKLIKRGMDSDFIIRRFRHERQILASFEHPFIARLLDGGTAPDGIPYFVMEFIEGDTFYNYCDAHRLSVKDRLKLFQKVCSAIQYAHEKQIIHRDIKPGNILINKSGTPKLLDFGIAKILDTDLIHESVNPTASMLRLMTPDYASPEQVRGLEVTPSSDIYSLSVLLYELLTGHRPYNFEGHSLHEVSRVICEVPAIIPSEVIVSPSNLLHRYADSPSRYLDVRRTDQKQLAQELERNLDDLVMKAMAKDPEDRYGSARELSEDISRHLNGNRVNAPVFIPNKQKHGDTSPGTPKTGKALAVLPFKYLNLGTATDTDDRFLGLGLADALITRLSKIRRFVVRPTGSILSFGDDQIDPVKAGKDLNVDFILDGNIKRAGQRLRVSVQLLNVRSNAAIWATSIDETIADVLTLETILANKVIDVLLPQLTGSEMQEFAKRGTDNPDAFEHYLRGRYHFNRFTEEGFAKAFVEFHSAIAADPDYALAYCGLADYYNWLGIIGVLPPKECFEPAILAASKGLELDPACAEAHASLGFSLHAGEYEWARAERHLLDAIELNPNYANAFTWYSIVLFSTGRFDEGFKYAKRSLEIDPLTPFNHHNLGWGLYYARRYADAARQYRKVMAEFPKYNFGPYGLSKVNRVSGNTAEAIELADRAKELMGSSIFSLLSEAECYAADGQQEIAYEKLSKLFEISNTRFVSPYHLALVYCFLGEKEKAIEQLREAYKIQDPWLNWMGVEPVLDPVRNEAEFQKILSDIGYAVVFSSGQGSVTGQITPTSFQAPKLDEMTTLRIEAGDETDDGIRKIKSRRFRPWIAVAAVFVLLGGAGYFIIPRLGVTRSPNPAMATFQSRSIVILPFKTVGFADEEIGAGLADALTSKLGNIKAIQVISSSAGRAISESEPEEIRKTVGAVYMLSGDLSESGPESILAAKLWNTENANIIWSGELRAPKGDLFALQSTLAEKVWTTLGIEPLPLELQEVKKTYTDSRSAYQYYLIGRIQMANRSRENLRRSIGTFSHAIADDPDFALAYVGLADAYALLNLYDIQPPSDAYPKAREYALRALSIDDGLAEAHATLAYVKFNYDRDRQGAELEFRRAIQLNPSYAQAHHWFALALTAMNKSVEALSEAQLAQRLDPRSASIKSATGIVYFMGGRFPDALAECDKASEIDPSFIPAIKVRRWILSASGDADQARTAFNKEITLSGGSSDDPGWKIIELQLPGSENDLAPKLAELDSVVSSDTVRKNEYAFAFEAALAFNALGDKEKALNWLERAESAGSHSFNFIAVEPRLKNLHSEPRFQKLLAKLF